MWIKTIWYSYKYRMICAALGILFHLGLIVLTLMAKGQAILILGFMDLPITLLFYPLGWIGIKVWKFDVLIYFVGGTLMYAVLGWCMGHFLEKQVINYRLSDKVSKNSKTRKDPKKLEDGK